MTTIKKAASPAYIAGEYYIFSAILTSAFMFIVGILLQVLLGGIFHMSLNVNFYALVIITPITQWFAIKYSARSISRRYHIANVRKTVSLAVTYKTVLFAIALIFNFANYASRVEMWNKTAETLQLSGGANGYMALTTVASIVSVAVFWLATKKYLRQ